MLNKKYWLQDIINIAREMGIGKKELMEDYYPAETYAIFKRQAAINKRREEESKLPPKEKTEEVYWNQMGI
jgi:hypothetical protein